MMCPKTNILSLKRVLICTKNLLRIHTGQNTQQHIHEKLIAKTKEKLSTTSLSISEIAYSFRFEHAQSFSTLFRKKTNLSPLEFRQAFN